MKKNITYIRGLFILLSFFSMLFTYGTISYAATDDPGAGRLSGHDIPEGFYDNTQDSDTESSLLRGTGDFTTVSPYTNATYTHQGGFRKRTLMHGIDVSQWQGDIDWKAVKASGIDYAFIRVGYRGYGQSGTLSEATKDPYFDTNIKNATKAGIKVGVYIFSQAITTKEAQEEADYILDHLGNYTISMPLVMDYEYASGSSDGGRLYTANLSKSAATNICKAFCKRIKAAGYTPMVYANKSMLSSQLNAADLTNSGYRIWLANYTTNTTYGGNYDFWQYASDGTVNGINGRVDMNFYYAQSGDNFKKDSYAIAGTTVSKVKNQVYTGKEICPPVTVKSGKVTLKKGTDYSIKYTDNIATGKATITIKGKGRYTGKKVCTFIIVPKAIAAPTLAKRGTTYLTLNWKKNSKATGYQIYRSDAPDGTFKRIKTISSKATTSYKDTDLTDGTYYYYKVRSYIVVDSKKYYSAFSPVADLYTKLANKKNAIVKKNTYLYAASSKEAAKKFQLVPNTILSVVRCTKDSTGNIWYKVKYTLNDKTYNGYVLGSRVTIASVGTIVKKAKVPVYKTYKTTAERITTVKKGTTINILKTKKVKGVVWYRITFIRGNKKYTGWVSSPYIKS